VSRAISLPRILRAFDQLPVQMQVRFQQWAQESFDRFYDEILADAMPSRRLPDGVRVGFTSPTDLRDMPVDDYVATLVRAARNASHGLMDILSEPRKPPTTERPDRRLLLATHQGEMPASLYEITRAAVFALLANPEALCSRSWFD